MAYFKNKKKSLILSANASFIRNVIKTIHASTYKSVKIKFTSPPVRFKHACFVSKKKRSVFSCFGVSRYALRLLSRNSFFSFIKKILFFSPYGGSGKHGKFKIYCLKSLLVQIQLRVYFF